MRNIISEIKRRNVHRAALGYLAGSWLLLQILETVFPIYGLDETGIRWIILVLALGFLPAMVLSWAFEWAPGGIKTQKEIDKGQLPSPKSSVVLDRVIIGVLSVALLFFAVDKFVVPTTPASIAVLPFEDMTAQQDQGYFGDGLAEELLNALSKNPDLRVAARTSSFRFRGSQTSLKEIADQLNVAHVLEGSVRRDGDRVRITAQLIDASTGYHVWSETYDESFEGIFDIQNSITAQIVQALKVRVLGEDVSKPTTNPETYELFLQSRFLARQGSQANYKRALTLLEQALELDPAYAPGWSNMSAIIANQAATGGREYDKGYGEARKMALRAIEADPDYSGGYVQLAWIAQWYDSDLAAAVRYTKKSVALEPRDPAILGNAAVLLLHLGKLKDSIALQEYSANLTPVDAIAFFNLGLAYKYSDRLDDAEKAFRKVLLLSPDYNNAQYQLGLTLLLKGNHVEALQAFEQQKEGYNLYKGRALANFALGNKHESQLALDKMMEGWGQQWPSIVVHVYAYRGEIEKAFEWMDLEYEKFGSSGWGEWRYQRLFDNLRSDQHWSDLMEKVGVSRSQLAQYEFDVTLPTDSSSRDLFATSNW